MKVHSTGSMEVEVNQAQERLYIQCLSELKSDDFRKCLLVALDYAEEHHVKQWLLDLREVGALDEEEETWLQLHLFPKIMMTLGTDNYVAIVLSEKCYQVLLNEAGKFGLQSYNSFIIINTFCEVAEALDWLDSNTVNKAS
ncbi:MAG: hypothetical protein LPK14_04500 [Hymenobacteraceae bacterium]|nr:hypothetical protein [Hymenobacteraceae bacterium]MDX5421491.1 hypothetical protein [Hymenobacteraceae bacterium]